ncbi:NFX1-type zinc finger-containing protein 1 [Mytilus edulis]|uniref:NFX1-type zinc finger-containing protein 1 n=1 Tax=Mytilus edulis TaxID=6550 RepID=A0A8S3QE56_MYTED|nr:NFX1-type zinc finger-containing protein 1 [Mytilus edulis]
MRPTISKLLVPHIYETLKNDANVFEYENVKGIHCDMFLMSHSVFEDQDHNTISKSHKNKFEALFICELYRYLRIQGYKSSEITVLSTYLDQVRLLHDSIGKVDEELTRKNAWVSSQQSVRIDTVDNFQGEENEIVLLSLVRSNREQNIGYLSSDNRVCVALSRAKKGFYAIGNFELLKNRSELWNKIVSDVTKRKHIGNRLQLTCQTHKTSTYVSKPEDFKRVVDGGCHKPCSLKRPCGHICLRKCHADDPDHEGHCPKQCKKVCKMGHQCTKPCHFPNSCEKCNDIVEKTIPKCQHVKRLPCHKDPQLESCGTRCQVTISCGHQCKNTCGDPCSTEDTCKQFIQVKARCGHGVLVVCSTKYDASCKLSCTGILSCGHQCKGTHSDCSQGRLHIPCKEKCKELTMINKSNTDAFRNTQHIEESTNSSLKWFIVRNLMTEHKLKYLVKYFRNYGIVLKMPVTLTL